MDYSDFIDEDVLSASTTLKVGAPFLLPIGFVSQKDQLLPASAIKYIALRESNKVF